MPVIGPPPNAPAVLQDVGRARGFYEQCLREARGADQMTPGLFIRARACRLRC